MQVDDLILVSVDDHMVEPPHLLEGAALPSVGRTQRTPVMAQP